MRQSLTIKININKNYKKNDIVKILLKSFKNKTTSSHLATHDLTLLSILAIDSRRKKLMSLC